LLAAGSCHVKQLPPTVRELLKQSTDNHTVRANEMPSAALDKCWAMFNEVLGLLHTAGRLGVVLLQHQNDVGPGRVARCRTESIRRRLLPLAALAVEFRNRDWISTDKALFHTSFWLHDECSGAALVCSDDLLHEMQQGDRNQRGLGPGEARIRIPLRWPRSKQGGGPGWAYCRIHRRYGDVRARTLQPSEIEDWCATIATAKHSGDLSSGPCYILLGTDAGVAPVRNASAMAQVGGPDWAYDWDAHVRSNSGMTLTSLWTTPTASCKNKRLIALDRVDILQSPSKSLPVMDSMQEIISSAQSHCQHGRQRSTGGPLGEAFARASKASRTSHDKTKSQEELDIEEAIRKSLEER